MKDLENARKNIFEAEERHKKEIKDKLQKAKNAAREK